MTPGNPQRSDQSTHESKDEEIATSESTGRGEIGEQSREGKEANSDSHVVMSADMDNSKDEEIAPQMVEVTEHEGSSRKDITREDQIQINMDDSEGKETILKP